MNESRTPSLAGSSGEDSPSLTGWGIAVLSGDQEETMTNYSQLLKDPRWQKVRLKKLEAAEWRCEKCMDSETMLSVHHKRYVKGRKPWEYEEHELVVLCQPCHEEEHAAKDLRSDLIACLHPDGPASASDFFAIAAGYIGEQTNDKAISSIVGMFYMESPYQVEMGKLLAAMAFRFRFSIGDLQETSDALLGGGSNPELLNGLIDLFEKHGIKQYVTRA